MPATYLDSQNATRDDLDLGTFRTGEGQHKNHTSSISLSAPTPKAALMVVRRCCLVVSPFPGSCCFNKLHTLCKTHQTHFIHNVQLLPSRFSALLVCSLNLSFSLHYFAPSMFMCACVWAEGWGMGNSLMLVIYELSIGWQLI